MRNIPEAAVDLVKRFEGIPDGDPSTVNTDPYLDPVGIWTIGYGHAIAYKGKFVRGSENKTLAYSLYPGGLTRPQCTDLLRGDMVGAARDVLSVVKVAITDNQYAALISFTFNVGIGNLSVSTLLKRLNAGDYLTAANEFRKWNKAGGVVLNGLTKRREAERLLFLS